MSYFGTEEQKFLNGEIRTDGWKSGWRLEQERRRKEEMGKRQFVTAPQIKQRQDRPKVQGPHNATPGTCDVCGTGIRQGNKTGRCGKHPMKRQFMRTDFKCAACDEPMRKTEFGICKTCFIRYRRRIVQSPVRVCAEPNCFHSLNKNNTYTKCRNHSRPDRHARERGNLKLAA